MRLPSSAPAFPCLFLVLVVLLGAAAADAALVARWTFDEVAGPYALDASGAGNHALLHGGATRVPGVGGHALALDGTSGYAQVTAPVAIPVGNAPRSVAAWVRIDAGTTDRFHEIVAWGTPLTDGAAFLVERGRDAAPWSNRLTVDGWNTSTHGATPLAAGAWRHVAATFDGSALRFYVDGVPDGSVARTYATAMGAAGLLIGDAPPNDGWHGKFKGALDDLRIYDHALDAAEVAHLVAVYEPGPAPVSHWTADDTTNDAISWHHMSFVSMAARYTEGRIGRAFALDGNGYLGVGGGFGMTGDWTVEAWARPDVCVDGQHCPLVTRDYGDAHAFLLTYLSATHPYYPHRFLLCIGTASTCEVVLVSTRTASPGTWHHVAATRRGDTYALYVDGELQQAQTVPGAPTLYLLGDYRLGMWHYQIPGGRRMAGAIDEVKVHDRGFDAIEMRVAAQAGGPAVALPFRDEFGAGLRALWTVARPDVSTLAFGNGALVLRTTGTDLWSSTNSLVNRPTVRLPDDAGDYELTAKLRFPVQPTEPFQQAGIVLYGDANGVPDEDNYLRVHYVQSSGLRFEVTYDVDGAANADLPNGPLVPVAAGVPIWLRITSRGGVYRAYYSLDGATFLPVSTATEQAFNAQRAGRMRHAGIFAAHGHGVQATPIDVQFDYVEITRGDCATLPAGLVGWWPGDGNGLDALGRNHAVARNGATYAPGRRRQAFSLDGIDDLFQVPAPEGFPWSGASRTMAGWIVGPRDFSVHPGTGIMQYGNTQSGQMFGLITSLNAPGALYFYGHSDDLAGGSLVPPGRWYHVAVTYDGDQHMLRLYVDGVPVTAPTSKFLMTLLTTDGFTIGDRPGATPWQGLIDEVVLFDRALSEAEIAALYGAPSLACVPYPASVALVSSANPVSVGQTVTLTATVSGGFGTPTGVVAFRDGPAAIAGCASVPLSGGQAQCTTAALTVGAHPLLASYGGDAVYAASAGGATQTVTAVPGQPCADFTDVDAGSAFCTSVQWLANRGITLGCAAGSYCPAASVSRLAMAAFMNRLGDAMAEEVVWREQASGALDPSAGAVVCVTDPLTVGAAPLRATLTAVLAGRPDEAVALAARTVASMDGGATWTPLDVQPLRATLAGGRWTNLRLHGGVDLVPGTSVQFALRLARDGLPGSATLTQSSCALRVVAGNRPATYAPFDAR